MKVYERSDEKRDSASVNLSVCVYYSKTPVCNTLLIGRTCANLR